MFFRVTPDGRRRLADLGGIFCGGSVFICGGHPSLKDQPLEVFQKPGITTLVMNNTGTMVRPDLWICADHPACYSKSIIMDPKPLKFVLLKYQNEEIGDTGKTWKDIPNVVFYNVNTEAKPHNALNDNRLMWYKNVFMVTVHLAYVLGFKEMYFCGVGLGIDKNKQYAYGTKLSDNQVEYNSRTYSQVFDQFKTHLPYFTEVGMEFYSCTEDSPMNTIIPFLTLNQAIQKVLENFPEHDTINVKHSSEFLKK